MRKVVVSEFVTLDGVMEDPGGAEGSTAAAGRDTTALRRVETKQTGAVAILTLERVANEESEA